MRIEAGWLARVDDDDPSVAVVRTPKHSALSTPGPLGVVWHWTGAIGSDPVAFCRSAASSSREASWHVLVTRDGRLIQGAPFTRGTWHVGRRGRVAGRERAVNGCTIGVELENAGRLKLEGGAWRYFAGGTWRGAVPAEQVAKVAGQGAFQDFPAAQVEAATALLAALVDEYGLEPADCAYGHVDFAAPGSREDPGPLWGCHRWPDGPVLREVLGEVFGAAPPLGLPCWVDDPGVAGNDCGGEW